MSSSEAWQMCPVIGLQDVRAGLEWFSKQLGFAVVNAFEPDSREGMVYAIVRRGGAEVHLQIRRRPLWGAARQSFEGDIYIRVGDADALHAELAARGVEIVRPPEDQHYGHRDFIVAAPEGYRLTFGARLPG